MRYYINIECEVWDDTATVEQVEEYAKTLAGVLNNEAGVDSAYVVSVETVS